MGLLVAVIFSAAMSSSSGEINSLATVSVIDFYRRFVRKGAATAITFGLREYSRCSGAHAVAFANSTRSFGALIEAVNQVGSLFYGSMLGVFVLAFFFKRVGGTGAFIGVLVGEAAILSLLAHQHRLFVVQRDRLHHCLCSPHAALRRSSGAQTKRPGEVAKAGYQTEAQ